MAVIWVCAGGGNGVSGTQLGAATRVSAIGASMCRFEGWEGGAAASKQRSRCVLTARASTSCPQEGQQQVPFPGTGDLLAVRCSIDSTLASLRRAFGVVPAADVAPTSAGPAIESVTGAGKEFRLEGPWAEGSI